MEAHEEAMKLSDRRALQVQAQHPQRMGAGRMGRKKMDMDNTRLVESEEEEEIKGKGMSEGARLNRLVGAGKKKPSKKVLEKIGKEALEEHEAQHEALGSESEAEKQGGMLSRHLMEKYGAKHAETFGKGFHKGMGQFGAGLSGGVMGAPRGSIMKGGNVDLISGAVDTGRVANPPPTFARNTVGMGKKTRAKASPSDARRRRGQAVSKLMKEQGMSLGEASRHIKEHGY
jgi:hypothetical protein